ncbi:MAG: glycogen/starch synthase [Prevotellaceae bacterium]|jgi:starch synthase|nr:glycogen/starch synthase [Prevotellaceae bacterium]
MTKPSKVLFIAQEVVPFVEDNDMALIGKKLPQATQERGREIRIFMPKWGNINERRNQLHEVIRLSGMNLIIDDTDHPLIIKVASVPSARMQVYFIDNDDYFQQRLRLTDADGKEYSDNHERLIFYARGVLETVKKLRWCPDIIHCHGWPSLLAPLYIKTAYKDEPSFRGKKVVLSLYDDEFESIFPANFAMLLKIKGVTLKDLKPITDKALNYEKLVKYVMHFVDGVVANAPNVNPELLEYARQIGKPVLEYSGLEHYYEACNDLYDEVWEQTNNTPQ